VYRSEGFGELPAKTMLRLAENAAFNSTASIGADDTLTGDRTECALLMLARDLGFDTDTLRLNVKIAA
jgi:magnesium-transporting ATPase (P-type)